MNRQGIGDHLAGNVVDTADPEPETPVLDAGKLGGLISSLVIAVVTIVFEVSAKADINTLTQAVVAAVGAAGAVVTYLVTVQQAKKATARVTPLTRPRDNLGRRLVVHPDDLEKAA